MGTALESEPSLPVASRLLSIVWDRPARLWRRRPGAALEAVP